MEDYSIIHSIAKNITNARCSQQLSVSQLAELADLSERNLYRIEAGEQNCSASTLLKIANALKVDMNELTDINFSGLENRNG